MAVRKECTSLNTPEIHVPQNSKCYAKPQSSHAVYEPPNQNLARDDCGVQQRCSATLRLISARSSATRQQFLYLRYISMMVRSSTVFYVQDPISTYGENRHLWICLPERRQIAGRRGLEQVVIMSERDVQRASKSSLVFEPSPRSLDATVRESRLPNHELRVTTYRVRVRSCRIALTGPASSIMTGCIHFRAVSYSTHFLTMLLVALP